MNFPDFVKLVSKHEKPVILLEGRRELPESDRPLLVKLGEKLAKALPSAIFRSGNAKGADNAFIEGVALVDTSRIENIVPDEKTRKEYIPKGSNTFSLGDIPQVMEERLEYETIRATPQRADMIKSRKKNRMLEAKSKYLLRDTLKVIGDGHKLSQPIAAIFYVNPDEPKTGGTGHTIRVCEQANIPVITQNIWMKWL